MAKNTATALVLTDPKLVAARTEGIKMSSSLAEAVDAITIIDEDSYVDADGMLGQIRNVRAKWRVKVDPIISPLKRAIDAAKLAMAGAKKLDEDIDGPMAELEAAIKEKMRYYKLVDEPKKLQAKRDEETRLAREAQEEADRKDIAAQNARTAGMRARLEEARATLQVQAAVHEEAAEDIKPVQAASSSARFTEKCRITDLEKFLKGMQEYTSADGVMKMQHPPYKLLRREKVMAAIQVELNKVWSSTPGVVKSWPGVEVYKDVSIAGR